MKRYKAFELGDIIEGVPVTRIEEVSYKYDGNREKHWRKNIFTEDDRDYPVCSDKEGEFVYDSHGDIYRPAEEEAINTSIKECKIYNFYEGRPCKSIKDLHYDLQSWKIPCHIVEEGNAVRLSLFTDAITASKFIAKVTHFVARDDNHYLEVATSEDGPLYAPALCLFRMVDGSIHLRRIDHDGMKWDITSYAAKEERDG